MVVCSELPGNQSDSVTNAAERVAGPVIDVLGLPVPLVWTEHHPPETTDGATETFDLVVFGHYEIRDIEGDGGGPGQGGRPLQ